MLLKEIKLQTSHLFALHDFYKAILELPTNYGDGGITVIAGKSVLIFEESTTEIHPFYHFAFNIPSNKFEQAFEWMKQKVEILWLDDYKSYVADFVNWHAKSFYFMDPAGNILELISRFDLNDIAEKNFSSAHIRNISEIGLVLSAENFQKDVDELLKQYPLPYFDKQPPLPQFKAIGDDEGLFIIVPENRIWFSTKSTESKKFPMEITFIDNARTYDLKR